MISFPFRIIFCSLFLFKANSKAIKKKRTKFSKRIKFITFFLNCLSWLVKFSPRNCVVGRKKKYLFVICTDCSKFPYKTTLVYSNFESNSVQFVGGTVWINDFCTKLKWQRILIPFSLAHSHSASVMTTDAYAYQYK